jgi:hypothetical protein
MMRIKYLTIHTSMDRASVDALHLVQKIRALKELVGHAQRNDVVIGLQSVTETPLTWSLSTRPATIPKSVML